MAYQVTLNEQEYRALMTKAVKSGQQLEDVFHEIMRQGFQVALDETRTLTGRELMEKMYREGKLMNLPNPRPFTAEEKAERTRLAKLFGVGKSASEMVIEDRGPY